MAIAACHPTPTPAAVAPGTAVASASSRSSSAPPISEDTPVEERTFDASSPEHYTESCAALLGEADPTLRIDSTSPLVLRILTPDRQLELNLHRVWRYCEGNRTDCEIATREYLRRSADQIVKRFGPPQMAQLRAAVREAEYVDSLRQYAPDLIAEPLVADLWLVYVHDTPTAARVLMAEELEPLEISAEQAKKIARQNVAEALGPLDAHIQALPEQGIGYIQTGNYYVSSYVLDAEAWRPVAARVRGRLLVAVPTRDLLIYADSASPHLDRVLEPILADMMRRSQVPLSKTILVWSPTGWTQWDGKP